ncbi:hypothetical protein SO802_000101 [Lithocarpus litseifolius]|uniref:Uncharacterized protein n=1 Tax=Lithocarpus litseifolius TaxID=425828 RepID=A0AAW2DR31_9ROSI
MSKPFQTTPTHFILNCSHTQEQEQEKQRFYQLVPQGPPGRAHFVLKFQEQERRRNVIIQIIKNKKAKQQKEEMKKTFNPAPVLSNPKSRPCVCGFFVTVTLICGAYFIGNAFVAKEYKERFTRWGETPTMQNTKSNDSNMCKSRCRPVGSESLPEGIVVKTSNLEMRPLWGSIPENNNAKASLNLLAIAVGIKQKDLVNQIVKKNDLIHAWGLDRKLGYCAQDRMKNVGVVDSEYIVHLGLPTLGGNKAPSDSNKAVPRSQVRSQSYAEMRIFEKRWTSASKEDSCWIDPYQRSVNQSTH